MPNAITIKSGDTLSGIAKANNTTVNALLSANPNITNPNLIRAGASLNLPTAPVVAPIVASPVINAPKIATPSVPSSAYTIKYGDTLSGIARAQGTTIAELMKLNPNITNPNQIQSGKPLNLPGNLSGGSAVPDYSGVNSIAEANKAINANQKADQASVTADGEPATRKTVDDIMREIETSVKPDTAKPATADFTGAYQNFRSEYGVNALETQLNDLEAEKAGLVATKSSRVNAERGKTVAMNVIEGRVSETERQENERIAAVENSINSVTNQLKTKYSIIDTLMKTKEMDYDAAVSSYDKEMTSNIAMYNAARNVDEANKSELEKNVDNARSNAQIAINAMTTRGMAYGDLSEAEKTNLTKLGVQSGLGADFFSSVLKVSSGKDILTTITSSDDTKATIIYKDGTTKTISTGLPAKKTTTGTGDKATESEIKVYYKQSMEGELKKVVGTDGYLSPTDWAKARRQWSSNTAYGASDFDDSFRGYVNPTHPQDYAGFEGYKSGFIKKSSAELEAGE